MNPSLRTPPVQKKGAALAMVARASLESVGCTNGSTWHQIGEFLDAQHLASFGLRLIPQCETKVGAQVAGRASGPLCAPDFRTHPVGNTGITSISDSPGS